MRIDSVDVHDHVSATSPAEAIGISEESIMGVVDGTINAVRVPDVLPPDVYADALKLIERLQFSQYDQARVFPPVARFGVSVNDHRKDNMIQDSYWYAVEDTQRAWSELGGSDLFALCRQTLADAWPHGVSVGRRGDQGFSVGMIREINAGLQIHFDDAMIEHDGGPFDQKLIGQIAFNLYLCVPRAGGELVVWNRRSQPSDQQFKIESGYGYKDDVVAGLTGTSLPPRAGEAILFDPRNLHTVRPSQDGRRIALAFCIGVTESLELVIWA